MFTADDALELENGETTPERSAQILQKAINAGTGWQMQGSYGRSMMQAIESGECMLGLIAATDAYQNRIPARHEVQEGSKGSRSFVVERKGEEWAQMLEALDAPSNKPAAPRP